jgi:hypothetical protein
LESLWAIGMLHDFLGKIGGVNAILPNVTSAQFLNASDSSINGAFCPNADWAQLCQTNLGLRQVMFPQWTLQALQIFALLDPLSPQSDFNAGAAWGYLAHFYVENSTTACFIPPPLLSVSTAAWTAYVSAVLLKANMGSYFALSKVVAWLGANLNLSFLDDVAQYMNLAAVGGDAVSMLPYSVTSLAALEGALIAPSLTWFHAQGGIWPDLTTLQDFILLHQDQHIFLAPAVPASVPYGGVFEVQATVRGFFDSASSGITITGTFMNQTVQFTPSNGVYYGWLSAGFEVEDGNLVPLTIVATQTGHVSNIFQTQIALQGSISAVLQCSGQVLASGGESTFVLPSPDLAIEVSFSCSVGGETHVAEVSNPVLTISQGEQLAGNASLVEGETNGSYAANVTFPDFGTYQLVVGAGSNIFATYTVNLVDQQTNATAPVNETPVPATFPFSIVFGGGVASATFFGAGTMMSKRTGLVPANLPRKSQIYGRKQNGDQ